MNTHTDTQLKQALAKMLPEKAIPDNIYGCCWVCNDLTNNVKHYLPVDDTELLHLCWLVESNLSEDATEDYEILLTEITNNGVSFYFTPHAGMVFKVCHATWQQRTIALCKVKGIEIV